MDKNAMAVTISRDAVPAVLVESKQGEIVRG
jgi:hypothetical protein